MSASAASTRAAAADGASPTTGWSPVSAATVRSIRVLPEPACPCTPNGAVGGEEQRARRGALAGVQPRALERRLDRGLRGEGVARVETCVQTRQEVALGRPRAVGHEGPVGPARGGLDEVPVAVQVSDGLVDIVERVPPTRVRERKCAQRVGREHRAAVRLGLAPAGVERGLLRAGRRVGPAPAAEVGEQLPASRGERIEHGARVAGNLEARHLSDEGGDGGVAEALEPGAQLVAVDRADEELRALHRGELRAAPLPCPVARHVGDDRVGMELGVEVAARHVAEGGRRQAVGPDSRAAPGPRLVAPGLEQLRLDEVERRAHRLVVRAHHPRAGAPRRVDERFERDGLGRREGDVHPGAVLVLAVSHPAEPEAGARHVAREQRLEALRPDRAAKPERGGELPVPGARPAVLGVAPRVVPVGLEVVHRRGRRAQPDHGRDHRRYSPAAGSNSSAGGAGARPPLGYTGTVTARGGVTTMRQLTLRWSTTALPAQLASSGA